MTGGALGLAEEQGLTAEFRGSRFRRVELAEDIELGGGWEIEDRLELGHEVDLAPSFEDVHTFYLSLHRVAVKVRGALFEFGEIFHRLHGSLRSEQALDIQSAK